VKVAIVTTSYPRDEDDFAGRFIAETVERLRARGLEVDVVAPGAYRDFGLAYGGGVVHNLRKRPWAAPALVASLLRAVRRAARTADVVHAYWLPTGAVAALSGKPFVVSLPGTDMELARRAPRLARAVLARAKVALAHSEAIAAEARRLGARDVRIAPSGIELPATTNGEAEPPQVLFVGRLSPEKGIEELLAATAGLDLVVAGDGPLRERVPQALGFVPPDELARLYERAALVVCPSRRDGFPVACAEAMAHARPVVATAVGGLPDMVVDGETGLLVPPRDPQALRAAIDRLLADPELRHRLGQNARTRIAELCDWDRILDTIVGAYETALERA
jgi:glycosyltransferase involved in cell wall biosynthesis